MCVLPAWFYITPAAGGRHSFLDFMPSARFLAGRTGSSARHAAAPRYLFLRGRRGDMRRSRPDDVTRTRGAAFSNCALRSLSAPYAAAPIRSFLSSAVAVRFSPARRLPLAKAGRRGGKRFAACRRRTGLGAALFFCWRVWVCL